MKSLSYLVTIGSWCSVKILIRLEIKSQPSVNNHVHYLVEPVFNAIVFISDNLVITDGWCKENDQRNKSEICSHIVFIKLRWLTLKSDLILSVWSSLFWVWLILLSL